MVDREEQHWGEIFGKVFWMELSLYFMLAVNLNNKRVTQGVLVL